MTGPKDTPQPRDESVQGIERPNREPLSEPKKTEVKKFVAARFRPVSLFDETFDTIIPTSLAVAGELLTTGYLPSFIRGGFITSFPRMDLAFEASEGDLDTAMLPVIAARRIGQRHELLAELNLHTKFDLPITDPVLWAHLNHPQEQDEEYLRAHGFDLDSVKAAIKASKKAGGVLIGIKGFPEEFMDKDIPHDRIEVIMGLGIDRRDLASSTFLNIDPSDLSLESEAYITGEELGSAERLRIKSPEITTHSAFKGLTEYKPWDILSDSESTIANLPRIYSDDGIELVEGYLTTPAYQQKIPTRNYVLPQIGEIHAILNYKFGTIDPLITQGDILSFYQRHRERFPERLDQDVIDALFAPFESVKHDTSLHTTETSPPLFSAWKKAKLHLFNFDRVSEQNTIEDQGIATSTIRRAIEGNRLTRIQGVTPEVQDFLSDLVTEIHANLGNEFRKRESAEVICEYLNHFKTRASVLDIGATFIHWNTGEEIQISMDQPSGHDNPEVYSSGDTQSNASEHGAVLLIIGDPRSSISIQAHTFEGILQLAVTNSRNRDPEITAKERWLFTEALQAALVLKLIPKAILDIYGNYDEFQRYLDSGNFGWNDTSPEGSDAPLYSGGLKSHVETLEREDEEAVHDVQVMQRLSKIAALGSPGIATLVKFDPVLLDEVA